MTVMTRTVEKIANDVKALPDAELEELLSWLADFEAERMDAWDKTIAADSQPGGRLDGFLARVRDDIAAGKTKPLDEVLDHK